VRQECGGLGAFGALASSCCSRASVLRPARRHPDPASSVGLRVWLRVDPAYRLIGITVSAYSWGSLGVVLLGLGVWAMLAFGCLALLGPSADGAWRYWGPALSWCSARSRHSGRIGGIRRGAVRRISAASSASRHGRSVSFGPAHLVLLGAAFAGVPRPGLRWFGSDAAPASSCTCCSRSSVPRPARCRPRHPVYGLSVRFGSSWTSAPLASGGYGRIGASGVRQLLGIGVMAAWAFAYGLLVVRWASCAIGPS
jgi:hypothetical protein